jgi:Tfp pilus assembly protein PilF
MSLLLQALQKASKDRDNNTGGSAVEGADDDDLALEPMPEPQLIEDAEPLDDIGPEPSSTPDDAADVMRASEAPSYTALDWARDHYMLTFLAGAALFAIVYGLYVYIQVSNPAWLRSTPAPVSAPVQTVITPLPAPVDDAPRISGLPAAADTLEPPAGEAPANLATVSGDTVEPMAAQANGVGTTAPRNAAPRSTAPRTAAAAPTAQPSPRVRQQAPPARQASNTVRATPSGNVAARLDSEGIEVIEIPVGPSVAVLPDSAATSNQTNIEVQTQDGAYTRLDPVLMMAYEALQLGQYDKAGALYSQVLSRDPDNIDAMLGLAAIAWKQGRPAVASQYYGRVLEMEPRNTHAQAGLIAILGNADPIAAETKLKQLIDREPSGFLYFTLGNLYAERSLWSQAQRAYFQAYQLQPNNSDYAFNLAVGLEHLGQARPALDYYRKALDLSFRSGRANFDQKLAIERVGQLSARVE